MNILSSQQINDLLRSDLQDPFSVLGMHEEETGLSVRAFLPEAKSVTVRNRETSKSVGEMTKVHEQGVFELHLPRRKKTFPYELIIKKHDDSEEVRIDPYSFLPIMTEEARYLFNEGNHQGVYSDLGSHKIEVDGIEGVVFAVWAPNAKRVSVVGDFNGWDGRKHPMRLLGASGIWELFIPGVQTGTVYKYEIKKRENDHLLLKTDPFGYYQEPFPHHGSIVWDLDEFQWDDEEWMESRRQQDVFKRPMSIYEVHLGSWCKTGPAEDGDYLSYPDLAQALADYVTKMGYTHIELMPIQEHPYVPSWGYQVSGFYAPNHRFGNPSGFQYFVNYMHKRGIGVILDWVPGHFPKDNFCLSHFDGTHLYEHQDPREGEHRDWGTLIFNFGRHEVHNFLTANALFWLDRFHVDGLRVDAVASMLYRNYSREEGDWIPNKFGGVENLEAIEFLQSMNYLVHQRFPGAVTIAEESTAWPMVSRPTHLGGLGFTFKWNMGWMNDILTYFSKDPIYRRYHHDQLTFGLWYAFNENFVLVLSHDEVVHGKRSLLEKMPGDNWQKFANLRALFAFMYGHPGKKLVFMGGEFGMHSEWYELQSIDWHLLEHCDDAYHHNGTMRLMADLNRTYKNESALWEFDFEPRGFSWIDHSDSDNSIVSFIRHGSDWHNFLVVVCNFTPNVHREYRIGVPHGGFYRELLNTDAPEYGGAGFGNLGGKQAQPIPWHGHSYSLNLTLPPLSVLMLKWAR